MGQEFPEFPQDGKFPKLGKFLNLGNFPGIPIREIPGREKFEAIREGGTGNFPLNIPAMNQARLLKVLQEYGVGPDMLEIVRHLYINTVGQAAGDSEFLCSTMGVR